MNIPELRFSSDISLPPPKLSFVEGKQIWLASQLLPHCEDNTRIGFTFYAEFWRETKGLTVQTNSSPKNTGTAALVFALLTRWGHLYHQ